MTNRLEREAEVWQAHGENYIARELRRLKSIAKAGGAPEEFEEAEPAIWTPYDYRPTPLQILRALDVEGNDSASVSSIVAQYNAYLGGRLPDEITPADLMLTQQKLATVEDVELLLRVGMALIANYNKPLHVASMQGGFDTVGKIRKASPTRINALRGIGPTNSSFLIQGFTRVKESIS